MIVDLVASADTDNNLIVAVPTVVNSDTRQFQAGVVRRMDIALLSGIRVVSEVTVEASEIGSLTNVSFVNPKHLRGLNAKLTVTPYSGNAVSVIRPVSVEARTRFAERSLVQPALMEEDDA